MAAFCIPWMPSSLTLSVLDRIGPWKPLARRLSRRHFPPLVDAPKIQGRLGEWLRLLTRTWGGGDERLSYQANDWLMRKMTCECRWPDITAVHAYEDCSLWQFAEAKRLGKACIYDMPIGYYSAWKDTEAVLARQYNDWLPLGGLSSSRYVRPEQKREEMNLADITLVPSSFVEKTIRAFHPYKLLARTPYGVDLDFWTPGKKGRSRNPCDLSTQGNYRSAREFRACLKRGRGRRCAMRSWISSGHGSWRRANEFHCPRVSDGYRLVHWSCYVSGIGQPMYLCSLRILKASDWH